MPTTDSAQPKLARYERRLDPHGSYIRLQPSQFPKRDNQYIQNCARATNRSRFPLTKTATVVSSSGFRPLT